MLGHNTKIHLFALIKKKILKMLRFKFNDSFNLIIREYSQNIIKIIYLTTEKKNRQATNLFFA